MLTNEKLNKLEDIVLDQLSSKTLLDEVKCAVETLSMLQNIRRWLQTTQEVCSDCPCKSA